MAFTVPATATRTAQSVTRHIEHQNTAHRAAQLDREVQKLRALCASLEMINEANEARLLAAEGFKGTGRDVLASVSASRRMPVSVIIGSLRCKSIIRVRYEAIYQVARCCPWLSYPEIGRLFGGRDHTTILHAINKWPKYALDLGIVCLPLDRERVPE